MLGRLIPEKQILNDQLKQVQQNSLHSRCFLFKVDIFLPHRQEMRTWKAVFPHCQFVFLISPCFSKTGDSLLTLKRALEAKELARQQLQSVNHLNETKSQFWLARNKRWTLLGLDLPVSSDSSICFRYPPLSLDLVPTNIACSLTLKQRLLFVGRLYHVPDKPDGCFS